jgi:2-polyprenyl-3-methyl-5-hydroxy-6-metoxy-1,4-benzoquinol methylase
MPEIKPHDASYRDPDGFVFCIENELYRQVNKSYRLNYELLLQSNLYQHLTEKKWLVKHVPVNENFTDSAEWFITLKPEKVPFISYPYEWSFDMLKDAALLTLDINKTAIEHGMILKDATPFNIQFTGVAPIFIDTLSFEKYNETLPWNAYKQFCECFLFPLMLSNYTKLEGQKFLSVYPDGLPINIVAAVLPFSGKWNINVWLYVYLQKNISHRALGSANTMKTSGKFNKKKMLDLLNGLYGYIKTLRFQHKQTWDDYYTTTIRGDGYLEEKEKIVKKFIQDLKLERVLDIGTNDGKFADIVAGNAVYVLATDVTSNCINQLYLKQKHKPLKTLLPLVIDIANPTAAIGFLNKERQSFLQRLDVEMVLALAVIHHLHFSNSIPLQKQAEFFSTIAKKYLLIEFVPFEDEKVKIITGRKQTDGHPYGISLFESLFSEKFIIEKKESLTNGRILYLMKNNLFADKT